MGADTRANRPATAHLQVELPSGAGDLGYPRKSGARELASGDVAVPGRSPMRPADVDLDELD